MRAWERTGRLVDLDVPTVRHSKWSTKDADEKRKVIGDAVREFQAEG
jgi:hypothetical protein